jgi:hypothetical protein
MSWRTRWLDHHSPAFTLSVYVDLLDGDLGDRLPSGGLEEVAEQHANDHQNRAAGSRERDRQVVGSGFL